MNLFYNSSACLIQFFSYLFFHNYKHASCSENSGQVNLSVFNRYTYSYYKIIICFTRELTFTKLISRVHAKLNAEYKNLIYIHLRIIKL